MTVLLFLNELSCAGVSDPGGSTADPDDLINGFVSLLVVIRRRRPDAALVSAARLYGIQVGGDFIFARWAADGRNKDRLRLLKSVRNRAPFQDVGSLSEDGLLDYLVDGRTATGLGYADAFDGLAVSLATADRWDTVKLALVRQELVESDTGEARLAETTVSVRHASRSGHVESHEAWLAAAGIRTLDARTLWQQRLDLLPDLVLLPRVEADLLSLGPVHLKQVVDELVRLQLAAAAWQPALNAEPGWGSKVTPEAEQRKKHCFFDDLDGVERLFHLHARYTPGPGRIHLRLDAAARKIRIAYIGRKRGI